MKSRSIVALCIHGIGHLRVLLPVVAALCRRDWTVHVMTHVEFQDDVERAGGCFIDLFARYPLDAADSTSQPVPSRYVSFAGAYAEPLAAEIAALDPGLILYDTFMVAGLVVGRMLGVPYVSVLPNHAMVPARARAALAQDARVATSPQCWDAVRRLLDIHGIAEADPFAYVSALSPFLNLYPEPAEFLAGEDRAALEPLAFFGCLAPELRSDRGHSVFPPRRRARRVYVSFGTVVWWYFEAAAAHALEVISRACADLDVDVAISLGGHPLDLVRRATIARENVFVATEVDQWATLREADAFVTHHGINSTHESIFHKVPMLSYPFFGDQPALAARCQDLGLAVPLGSARDALDASHVRTALSRLWQHEGAHAERLAEACGWESRTIAGRDAVVERLEALLAKE